MVLQDQKGFLKILFYSTFPFVLDEPGVFFQPWLFWKEAVAKQGEIRLYISVDIQDL